MGSGSKISRKLLTDIAQSTLKTFEQTQDTSRIVLQAMYLQVQVQSDSELNRFLNINQCLPSDLVAASPHPLDAIGCDPESADA
jgi:hypothetical protein